MKEIGRQDLLGLRGLAVVELYKEGCAPCEQLYPVLEELSGTYGGIQFLQSHLEV